MYWTSLAHYQHAGLSLFMMCSKEVCMDEWGHWTGKKYCI
jgi:hypothetical protein